MLSEMVIFYWKYTLDIDIDPDIRSHTVTRSLV